MDPDENATAKKENATGKKENETKLSLTPSGLIPKIKKNFVWLPLKYILFFACFASWLLGLFLMGLGMWELVVAEFAFSRSQELYNINVVIHFLSSVAIVSGFFLFAVSFTGCLGALRENLCLLRFFYRTLLCLLLAELFCGAALLSLRDPFVRSLESTVTKHLIVHYEDDPNAKTLMDLLQQRVGCCGITSSGYTDWNLNPYYNCSNTNTYNPFNCSVPFTCCIRQDTFKNGVVNIFCGAGILLQMPVSAASRIHTAGCLSRLKDLTACYLPIVCSIVFTVVAIQVLGVLMARHLSQQVTCQIRQWTIRLKETTSGRSAVP